MLKHWLPVTLGISFLIMIVVIAALLLSGPERPQSSEAEDGPASADNSPPPQGSPANAPPAAPVAPQPAAQAPAPTPDGLGVQAPTPEPEPERVPPKPEPEQLHLETLYRAQFGTRSAEVLRSVALADDGGVLLAGSTTGPVRSAGEGGADALAVVFAADGTLSTTLHFGTPAGDEVLGVQPGVDGQIIVCGTTQGALAGENNGGRDGFVAAFDPTGKRIWAHQFGTPADDRALAVATDSQGNVYTCGVLGEAPAGGTQAFLTCYNAQGLFRWTRLMDSPGNEQATGVAIDPRGNAVVCGWTDGPLSGEPLGGQDGLIAKYAPDGARLSLRVYGSKQDDSLTHLAIGGNGEVTAAGQTKGEITEKPGGGRDVFALRIGPDGEVVWSHQHAGTGQDRLGRLALHQGKSWLSGAFTPRRDAPADTDPVPLVVLDAQGSEAVIHSMPVAGEQVLVRGDRVVLVSSVPGRAQAQRPNDTDYRIERLMHAGGPIDPVAPVATPWKEAEHGSIDLLTQGQDDTFVAVTMSTNDSGQVHKKMLRMNREWGVLGQHRIDQFGRHDRSIKDYPHAIDPFGSLVVAGHAVRPLPNGYSVRKIGPDGQVAWQNGVDGLGSGVDVACDPMGNCLFVHERYEKPNASYRHDPNTHNSPARLSRLIKYGPEGREIWRFDSTNDYEVWRCVEADADGRATVWGSTYKERNYSRQWHVRPTGHFAMRLDTAGKLVWRVPIPTDELGTPRSMLVDAQGRIYFLVQKPSPSTHIRITSKKVPGRYVLARLSDEGELMWVRPTGITQRTVVGNQSNEPIDRVVKLDRFGNIIVASNDRIGKRVGEDFRTLDIASSIQVFNPHGDIVWEQTVADHNQVVAELAGDTVSGITRVLRHETYNESGRLTDTTHAIDRVRVPGRITQRVLDGTAALPGAGYNGYTLDLLNSIKRGRGVSACDIKLINKGEVVRTFEGIGLRKDRQEAMPTSIRLPEVPFDEIRIEVTEWVGASAAFARINILDTKGQNQNKHYTVSVDRQRDIRPIDPRGLLFATPEGSWIGPDDHPSVITLKRK